MNSRGYLCRLLTKALWGAAALASTASAGSVFINKVNANDKNACAAFRKMIVAADIAHMTQKELCDFRFARLDRAKTTGFTFPSWTELSVKDPVERFREISLNNNPPGKTYLGSPRPDILESVSLNSKAGNLKFYTTHVRIEGKGTDTTLLLADLDHCPSGELNNEMGAPAIFAFEGRGFDKQVPMQLSSFVLNGAQVALWKGRFPVALSVSSRWVRISDRESDLVLDLTGWNRRNDGPGPEYINAYTVCTFTLGRTE
jgi:hypothetical protein